MRVELSTNADRTLFEIPERLEPYGLAYCERVVEALNSALLLLERRPEIGRPIGTDGLRLWSVSDLPYVIPYRLDRERDVLVVIDFHFTRRPLPERWPED